MQAPRIDLFEWLHHKAPHARYNLAFSNVHGLTVHEYQTLTDVPFSDDFELGSNAQYGAEELKKTLCAMYHCADQNIVTTTGATEANYLVFASLLGRGDECIIERPGYQPMWATPQMLGARCVNWLRPFEQRFSIQLDTLEHLLSEKTKLVVLTNLHNPSGVQAPQTMLKDVAHIAADHGVYVLIDEIFLDGSFIPALSSYGIPNVIVTTSATKIYGLGGLHSGWMIGPDEVIAQCQRMKAHTTGASSYTSEIMTARILAAGRNDLMKRFQLQAKTNFEYVKKWMRHQNEYFEWVEPDGGIVCFPRYTMKIPSVDLCRYLYEKQKVLVNPGSFFNQDGFIRLSYGSDLPLLKKSLDALEKGLYELQAHLV